MAICRFPPTSFATPPESSATWSLTRRPCRPGPQPSLKRGNLTMAPTQSTTSAARTLGLLTIGRKRPGFDQQWNQVMRTRADEALAALGLQVVRPDEPVVDDQTTRAAIDRLRAAGCEALLVLQPSLGNGQLALTV